MNQTLTVYKASAGSGKTFTLAVQYIKHLIREESGHAYSHILAVTFTNKATAEMKDRILQQLFGIWKGLPSSEGYLRVLQQEMRTDGIEIPEEDIRRRAGRALCRILHDYDRFRVETIDAFFQSVVKNLAHELNLNANLKVDLNDGEVLNAAVDRIMERLHLTPVILNWVQEYVEDRIANDQRWDIAKEVKSFASWIFKEAYLTHEQEIRNVLKENQKIAELRKALNQILQESEDIIQSAVGNFRDELEQRGLTCATFSRGSTLDTYLKRLAGGLFEAEFGDTLQKYIDNPSNMLRKADRNVPELSEAATHFSGLLSDLRDFQRKCLIRHNSAKLSLKHLNPLRLLEVIDEEVARLNHENNRFLLAKTPILLHDLIEDQDAPFIYEKMGTYVHHIMIDEFQDTSAMQWKNFKVLLQEGMASGHGNLIVGDVKQSIYRWRNGDWSILNHIDKEMAAYRPDIRNLDTNHRSERRLIAFNNAFFPAAAAALDDIAPEASTKLAEIYADVAQQCPPQKTGNGHVCIRFYDEKDKTNEAQMLDELCQQVERLHREGLPYGKMAILLRKRKFADPIIRHFATRLPDVKIVSDEAFLLSSSLAINILIAAMRYMANPEDKVSLAVLALHANPGIPPQTNARSLAGQPLEQMVAEEYIKHTEELKLLPLYELQEKLYKIFGLSHITGEDAYLFAYFDQLTAYVQDNPSDLPSFLKFWDERLCNIPIPSGEIEGIRIFTVHQSKGLQFHTVFAPYCDWEIEQDNTGNRNNNLLWCETHEAPYDMLPVIPVTIEKRMRDSIFRAPYEEEHLQRRVDALNLLYVTFTRAEKNLFAWCRTRYTMDERSTIGDLIHEALPHQLEGAETEEGENGQIARFAYGTPATQHIQKQKETDNRMEINYLPTEVNMHSYKARIEFCQSNRAEDFLESMSGQPQNDASTRQGKRRLGLLMHSIFSTIYTRADVEKALRRLETEGQIGTLEEKEDLKRQVEQAFKHPEVARWFDGTMQLYNECPILTQEYREESGKYGTYRPDRVMFAADEAIVTDFKFGAPRPEYRDQVAGYMNLLSQMEPQRHIKGYLWYILDNRLEEVTI